MNYTVGPSGCDYTTFTALLAANTLAAADVVEFRAETAGGSATFNEDWSPNGSGTSGSPITIQARLGDTITNDRGYAANNAVSLSSKSWITYHGLRMQGTNQAVILVNGGTGIVIEYCYLENGLAGTPAGQDKTGITFANSPSDCSILYNTI